MPYWRLAGVYFTYFSVVGAISPFWGLYLEHLEFDARAIGILAAIPMLTRIFAPNLWGWIVDTYGRTLFVVRLGAAGACICFVGVLFHYSFWGLVFYLAAFSFFWNAILAQFESITLRYLNDRPYVYGRIRLWGSVGFIVAVVGLGVLFDFISVQWLPTIIFAFLIGIFLYACSLPRLPKSVSQNKHKVISFFGNSGVVVFFITVFLLQFSHGVYYAFYSIYLKDEGYLTSAIGVIWAVGVIAEIFIFMRMPIILRRFSLYHLMSITLILTAFRWLVIAWCVSNVVMLFVAQLLHAFSFGVAHAVTVEYIRRQFGDKHQGQGLALYNSVGFGAGGAIGMYVSGEIWAISPQIAFSVASLAAFIAWLLTVVYLKKNLTQG